MIIIHYKEFLIIQPHLIALKQIQIKTPKIQIIKIKTPKIQTIQIQTPKIHKIQIKTPKIHKIQIQITKIKIIKIQEIINKAIQGAKMEANLRRAMEHL